MVKNLSCGFRMTVILLMSAKSAVVCPPVSENVSLFLSVCVFIYLLPAREKGVCKLSSDNKNTLTSDADIILSQNKALEI